MMSNKTFDRLRFLAEVGIPAAVTLILAITQIWNLPYGQQIGATLAACGTFIGALVGIQRNNYQSMKGAMSNERDDR